jgi:pimeloyl-ACP methyl ester carboxylesterase
MSHLHRAKSLATVETLRLTDGRNVCVRRWPGAGRRAVVLLHGLLDSSEGWSLLCERMHCTTIAIDLPGFGYSDAPSRGSIGGYARDVAFVLEALGVERFTVVGHSLGGAVAAALAELMPDRADGVVLLAPAGFGHIRLAEAVSLPGIRTLAQVALPVALSSETAVRAAYQAIVTNGEPPEPELVARVTSRARNLVEGAREGTRAVVDAGRSKTAFHRRRVRYDGPVFVVWGDRDKLVPPSHRRGVLTAFPQALIQVWAGMGHHPPQERRDDLIRLIWRATRPVAARPLARAA